MFKTDKIVEDKFREDTQKRSRSDLAYTVSSSLGFFSKRVYDSTLESIYEIVSKIEADSGWKYVDHYFVLRTDFSMLRASKEIEYKTHTVSLVGEKITLSSGEEVEKDFVRKYGRLLLQLRELEKKKEKIERENLSRIAEKNKVIPFNPVFKPAADQLKTEKEIVQYLATFFTREYGERGECILLMWLNNIANSEHPMDRYQDLKRVLLPEKGKESLLSWISTYTTGGERIFDHYMKEKTASYDREQKVKVNAFPYSGEGDI